MLLLKQPLLSIILDLAAIREGGIRKVVERDQAHIRFLQSRDQQGTSFNVTNALAEFTAEVGVGSPPTNYTLVIDSGSSNTWVGASKQYVQTSTSKSTGEIISVTYGSSFIIGKEWVDTVTLALGLVIENQSIGVADKSGGFTGVDGILGIGPVDQTSGTVSNTSLVPTVSDNLYRLGKIPTEVIGVLFPPPSKNPYNGTLTFGGIEESATTGPVKYVPLTKTSPASGYWGIDQSVSYGDTVIMSTTAGIVDTGTTLLYLASDAFQKYRAATGGVLDTTTGLVTIAKSKISSLKPLSFQIGDSTYEISPAAQVWPRSLNIALGGHSSAFYLVVCDIGRPSGSGLDFVNGYAFIQHWYTVFDTTNQRIGFASTIYTSSTD